MLDSHPLPNGIIYPLPLSFHIIKRLDKQLVLQFRIPECVSVNKPIRELVSAGIRVTFKLWVSKCVLIQLLFCNHNLITQRNSVCQCVCVRV